MTKTILAGILALSAFTLPQQAQAQPSAGHQICVVHNALYVLRCNDTFCASPVGAPPVVL